MRSYLAIGILAFVVAMVASPSVGQSAPQKKSDGSRARPATPARTTGFGNRIAGPALGAVAAGSSAAGSNAEAKPVRSARPLLGSQAAARREPRRAQPAVEAPVAVEAAKVYGDHAGENAPHGRKATARDRYGNAAGNEFDLARDGAFAGKQIAVLQLSTGEGFDFELPRVALQEKGFELHRWTKVPSVDELHGVLQRSSQLWVISNGVTSRLMTPLPNADRLPPALRDLLTGPGALDAGHRTVIGDFFRGGRGLYLWGDNEPYFAEANMIAQDLFRGASMSGNLPGQQVVEVQGAPGTPGFVRGHLLTTGLESLYEGFTVASLSESPSLQPLLYGSAGNLIAAYHDRDGRRAIMDGGFTRLYLNWDTAGTARYVKNAAAWLANTERHGN
jgi:hypothetical protein